MSNNWNIRFWEYEFFAPHWLWLMLALPILLYVLYQREKRRTGDFYFSGTSETQHQLRTSWIGRFRELLLLLKITVVALFVFALAKPFHWSQYSDFDTNYTEGIDIILAMDVSLSMLAMDFKPNRLEASKRVAEQFVEGRRGDRIGLVVYAGEAYTACPATLDYDVLKKQIQEIDGERIEGGTAIGTGLGTAVTRLRNDSIGSKVIILLTDGSNNAGDLSPLMAAELARAKNVRVYTIGVGSQGKAPSPVITPFGVQYQNIDVEIDEVTLMKIAETTGGNYFRATDEKSLESIYNEIERLEKRKMEDQHFKSEPPSNPSAFLNWAIVLMLFIWGSQYSVFKHHE